MLSTGLFDTSLCMKFNGFVLKTKDLIPIFLSKIVGLGHFSFLQLNDWSIRTCQALSKRYVIMFKNIFDLCPLQSIDTERECYNILLDHENRYVLKFTSLYFLHFFYFQNAHEV